MLLEAGLTAARDDGTVVPALPRPAALSDPRSSRPGRRDSAAACSARASRSTSTRPESAIFHKGKQLYNLHQAKGAIRKEEAVILVEGYFDVLRLVLAGLEHVVAPLGTALTADQAALLRRFAPAAMLLYDSDQAGLRATFRAGDELLRHGVRVRVATLPPGEDPDTLVRAGGAAALEPVLRDAMDVLERKIQLLERKGWFEGRRAPARGARPAAPDHPRGERSDHPRAVSLARRRADRGEQGGAGAGARGRPRAGRPSRESPSGGRSRETGGRGRAAAGAARRLAPAARPSSPRSASCCEC